VAAPPVPSALRSPGAKRRLIERLRARLARLDSSALAGRGAVLPLGIATIDRALPRGGLVRGALHELFGGPAALGFAVMLSGRLAGSGAESGAGSEPESESASGHVLWIGPRDDLFAPGLVELSLPPEQLIVVRARARDARLWALEEGLRSPGLAVAVAEIDRLDLTRSRRLQLAAEASGVSALLLRPSETAAVASVALTRWRISPLADTAPARPGRPPFDLGPPRWQLELFRCRGGRTGRWQIAWREGCCHEITDPLPLAAEPADRPAAPQERRRSA
jgi:protein ImuA